MATITFRRAAGALAIGATAIAVWNFRDTIGSAFSSINFGGGNVQTTQPTS